MKKKLNTKPAIKYIRRPEVSVFLLRLPKAIKTEAEKAADKIGTSMNKLVEASVRFYLDNLD